MDRNWIPALVGREVGLTAGGRGAEIVIIGDRTDCHSICLHEMKLTVVNEILGSRSFSKPLLDLNDF